MGLLVMILGLVLFLGVHTLTTQRTLRARVIAATGEGGYKIGYALVSLLGLVLIVRGFSDYRATGWIDVWSPPKALKHITEAPMLSGVNLWAAAHLLANGDFGGIILFGSFLGWAVFDRISLKHRADAGGPPIPVGGVGNDLIAVAVGLVAYLALGFAFHPVVIGVPVFGV